MITSIEDLLHCPVLSGCAFWSLFLLSLLRLLNGRIRPGRPRAAAHLIQKELRGGLPTTADSRHDCVWSRAGFCVPIFFNFHITLRR